MARGILPSDREKGSHIKIKFITSNTHEGIMDQVSQKNYFFFLFEEISLLNVCYFSKVSKKNKKGLLHKPGMRAFL